MNGTPARLGATLLLFILLMGSASAALNNLDELSVRVKPKVGGNTQVLTSFNYVFVFSQSNTCSPSLLNVSRVITTDAQGEGVATLDISSMTSIPSYMCEYRDGVLRYTHALNPNIFTNNSNATDITSGTLGIERFPTSGNWTLNGTINASGLQVGGSSVCTAANGLCGSSLTGGYGINITDNKVNISSPTCNSATEKSIWTGSAWTCEPDAGAGGGMTSWTLSNGSTTQSITDGGRVNITSGRNITITQTGAQLIINAIDTDTTYTSTTGITLVGGAFGLNTTYTDARYLQSYTETDPLWNGNSSRITNLENWNTTTQHKITSIGNWTADKGSYATTAYVGTIGNWTADKSSYQTIAGALTLSQVAANVGNWTADKGSYATTASLSSYALQSYAASLGNWSADKTGYSTTAAGDLRWLGINAAAANSNQLAGQASTYYLNTSGGYATLNYVASTGNWTADKANYALAADVSSRGNWSSDKPNYATTASLSSYALQTYAASLGNWSAEKGSYATTAYVDTIGNWTADKTSYVTTASTSSWDKNSADDFNGAYASLAGKPTHLSNFTNDGTFITAAGVPAAETDAAHDTCAEISGCVENAITSVPYQSTAGGWTNTTANTTTSLSVGIGNTGALQGKLDVVNGGTGSNWIGNASVRLARIDSTNEYSYGIITYASEIITGMEAPGSVGINSTATTNDGIAWGGIFGATETGEGTAYGLVVTSGNFGVGTLTPAYGMDVVGTARISGATYLTNSKCASGAFITSDTTTGLLSCATPSSSEPLWTGNATRVTNLETSNTTTNGRIDSLNTTKLNIADLKNDYASSAGVTTSASTAAFSASTYDGLLGLMDGRYEASNATRLGDQLPSYFLNITGFAAENLTSGTVNSARLSGAYTGITGLGTLTANLTTNAQINHTITDGATRYFANGCYEKSNSTGVYFIC